MSLIFLPLVFSVSQHTYISGELSTHIIPDCISYVISGLFAVGKEFTFPHVSQRVSHLARRHSNACILIFLPVPAFGLLVTHSPLFRTGCSLGIFSLWLSAKRCHWQYSYTTRHCTLCRVPCFHTVFQVPNLPFLTPTAGKVSLQCYSHSVFSFNAGMSPPVCGGKTAALYTFNTMVLILVFSPHPYGVQVRKYLQLVSSLC